VFVDISGYIDKVVEALDKTLHFAGFMIVLTLIILILIVLLEVSMILYVHRRCCMMRSDH